MPFNNVEGPGERHDNKVGIESISNAVTSTHTPAEIDVSGPVEDFEDVVNLTPIPFAFGINTSKTNYLNHLGRVEVYIDAEAYDDDETLDFVADNLLPYVEHLSVETVNVTTNADDLIEFATALSDNDIDKFTCNVVVEDTQENLQDLFSTDDENVISLLRQVTTFTSSDENSTITLDWEIISDIVDLDVNDSIDEFISKFNVDEITVSGTADEIEAIFDQFGTDFSDLPFGVSFKINDGGEVELTPAQLDKLDGRISGSVVIGSLGNDDATVEFFEGNVSDVVKDVQLEEDDAIYLTVDQFRNAPSFLDKTGSIYIADTSDNIANALNYSVLDDRVDGIILDNEGYITLSVAEYENINGISILDSDGNLAEVEVRDRASAIASLIESGDFSIHIDKFTNTDSGLISLDYAQTVALNALIAADKVGSGVYNSINGNIMESLL